MEKKKYILWILGWVLIFPVPLAIILFKRKTMKLWVKIAIVAVAALVYLAIVFSGSTSENEDQDTRSLPDPIQTEETTASDTDDCYLPVEPDTTTDSETTAETNMPETVTKDTTAASITADTTASTTAIDTTVSTTAIDTTVSTTATDTTAAITITKNNEPAESGIEIISITSPVHRNSMAALKINGKPNTEYKISVYYSTAKSTADGLEPCNSDNTGIASWTWKVGGKTKAGKHRIVITGGGERLETEFETLE